MSHIQRIPNVSIICSDLISQFFAVRKSSGKHINAQHKALNPRVVFQIHFVLIDLWHHITHKSFRNFAGFPPEVAPTTPLFNHIQIQLHVQIEVSGPTHQRVNECIHANHWNAIQLVLLSPTLVKCSCACDGIPRRDHTLRFSHVFKRRKRYLRNVLPAIRSKWQFHHFEWCDRARTRQLTEFETRVHKICLNCYYILQIGQRKCALRRCVNQLNAVGDEYQFQTLSFAKTLEISEETPQLTPFHVFSCEISVSFIKKWNTIDCMLQLVGLFCGFVVLFRGSVSWFPSILCFSFFQTSNMQFLRL